MPLGFLALFFMPFGLEKYFLILMGKVILLIEKTAIFVTELNFSHLTSPAISGFGIILAIIGLLLFCLLQSRFRFIGIALFLLSFASIIPAKKPDILFESKHKVFALKTDDGFVFSKNIKPSKYRQFWMNKLDVKDFKYFSCKENYCEINQEKKFLVISKRMKNAEICKKDFDVIVNMTAKYQLPDCVWENKTKIDNKDFYLKGGQFFNYEGKAITF